MTILEQLLKEVFGLEDEKPAAKLKKEDLKGLVELSDRERLIGYFMASASCVRALELLGFPKELKLKFLESVLDDTFSTMLERGIPLSRQHKDGHMFENFELGRTLREKAALAACEG